MVNLALLVPGLFFLVLSLIGVVFTEDKKYNH